MHLGQTFCNFKDLLYFVHTILPQVYHKNYAQLQYHIC